MSALKPILKTKDYFLSQEEFELVYNPKTDMLITSPKPESIERYYDSSSYISHRDKSKGLIDKIYRFVKSYTLKRKLQLINNYASKEKKLLDIGAGTGEFLSKAKNNGWTTLGVEPNSTANSRAIEKGISIITTLEQLPETKFDIITLWHVLEHIANLEEQIEKIVNCLYEEGSIIIAVPNYKSYDAVYYKNHWAAYDVPRHLWHFSQNSIAKLFKKHGLEVVRTIPMLFDSFYVSLLSEKYKTGKVNYISAFYRGLRSNLEATKTGEFSSLIYVLQRPKT